MPNAKKDAAEAGGRLKSKQYERELAGLHVEFVKLQQWVVHAGLKVCIVFEGRDGAGKGGTIKAMTERVSPRIFRVVALPAPSEREKTQMYSQRYIPHLPAAGEVVVFDRSWYNRADVDFETREVAIVRQGGGGLPKQRSVDVLQAAARLFEILGRWRLALEARGTFASNGPVFPCPHMLELGAIPAFAAYPERTEVLTATALRKAVARAGLPNVVRWTPHSLRDSFVTLEAAAAGGDLRRVQARARQASLTSTVRYLRALERGPAAARPGFELPEGAPRPPELAAAAGVDGRSPGRPR